MEWVRELQAAEDARWDQLQSRAVTNAEGYIEYCVALSKHLDDWAI